MKTHIDKIVGALKSKACVKQDIYHNTLAVFGRMKSIAEALTDVLSAQFEGIDKKVQISYREVNEFEFHLKFSGDLLMFTMHSNVTTFGKDHVLFKSPYIQEDPNRGYFGQIMVYNFMADSLKYNRLNDPGYLIARMMLNLDGHFYVEGVRQMTFLYPDISLNMITDEIMRNFIESAMLLAIAQDLYLPRYQDVQIVPLGKKIQNQMVHGGNKVGFQMNADRDS